MRFLLTNAIWLLFNLPIIYLAVAMVFSQSVEEAYMLGLTAVVLLPVFFFPATMAMFAVTRQWVMKQKGQSLFRSYLRFYKENYVRSILSGLAFIIIWGIWGWNYVLSGSEFGSIFSYIYLIGTVMLLAFTGFYFADNVHFKVGLLASFRKAFFLAIGHAISLLALRLPSAF